MSNITNGGKVHTGIRREAANGLVWYDARCGAGCDRTGQRRHRGFKVTESEVSCKTCLKITATGQPVQAEEPFNYNAKFVELDELVKIDNQVVAAGYSREEYNVAAISEIVRNWKRNQDVDAFTFEGLLDFIASRHQLPKVHPLASKLAQDHGLDFF